MDTNDFENAIKPFGWCEYGDSVSVRLEAGEYKREIFQTREDEGFEGNGYDWASLAKVFLEEKEPELIAEFEFDPEAGLFCVYSSNPDALKAFIIAFKAACENESLIQDLFSRAELD